MIIHLKKIGFELHDLELLVYLFDLGHGMIHVL